MELLALRLIQGTFERYRTELKRHDSAIKNALPEGELEREVREAEEVMENLEAALLEVKTLVELSHRPGQVLGQDEEESQGQRERHGEELDRDGETHRRSRDGDIESRRRREPETHRENQKSGESAGRCFRSDQPEDSGQTGIGGLSPLMPKLPKLEIAKFGGDPKRWQAFWDRFESSVGKNSRIASADKLSYLMGLLEGRALQVVEGLELSNDQYPVAVSLLKEEFGDPIHRTRQCFDNMMHLKVKSSKLDDVRNFYFEMQRNIRSLEALGKSQDTFGDTFVSLVLSKLPEEITIIMNDKKSDNEPWTLPVLSKALRSYISNREKAKKIDDEPLYVESRMHSSTSKGEYNRSRSSFGPRTAFVRTTSSLISSAAGRQRSYARIAVHCAFCDQDGDHYSDMCPTFPDVYSRKRRLGRRCYNCLRADDHLSRQCPSPRKCFYCKGAHHRALCEMKFGKRQQTGRLRGPQREDGDKRVVVDTSRGATSTLIAPAVRVSTPQKVLLPTAIIGVLNPRSQNRKTVRCHLIFDSGSQRSYITRDLADKLKLKCFDSDSLLVGVFGTGDTSEIGVQFTRILVKTLSGQEIEISVTVIPTISAPISKATVDIHKYAVLQGLTLAEPLHDTVEEFSLDLLIGSDYYNEFMLLDRMKLDAGLYATNSVFGWILSGRVSTSPACASQPEVSLLAPTFGSSQDSMLEKFWKLESIGVCDPGDINDDDIALKRFNETVKFENNRYSVSFPWKEPALPLPENFETAYGRLQCLNRRFDKQPEVLEAYSGVIRQQLADGIIEKVERDVSDGPRVHYLPHHGVYRSDAISTKLRIVYDASSKANKDLNSLNDCLYRGPVLLQNLCGLLLRFRSHPIGIVSDIEKAFLQIALHLGDRDVTRFLCMNSDNRLEIYRFGRVPFGVNASPFLLEATVRHHLSVVGTDIALKIRDNIYVDNTCLGTDSVEEAKDIYDSAKTIFRGASMNLREWFSNSSTLLDHIPPSDRLTDDTLKVLGMAWHGSTDMLSIRKAKLSISPPLTKRKILAAVSSIFDPLGLFSPVIMRAKLIIQNLWKLKLPWDSELPPETRQAWSELHSDLITILDLTVPRFIGVQRSLERPSVSVELHCFCDASAAAYAACLYLRITDGDSTVTSLIFSKTRLAPIQALTIPRLELLAVLIGTRLIRFAREQLPLAYARQVVWTDSSCVLAWVASSRLKSTFVENRLREVRTLPGVEFRFVPTADNPADLPSRGLSVAALRSNSLWWGGPSWLKGSGESWPAAASVETARNFDELESKRTELAALTTTERETDEILSLLPERCRSSWMPLIRMTAWILRLRDCIRKTKPTSKGLDAEELARARQFWELRVQEQNFGTELRLLRAGKSNCLIHQLNLFIDESGLIRCKGRLGHLELLSAENCPVLLPKEHWYTILVIDHVHLKLFHSGVRHILAEIRKSYWIPSARRIIGKVIRGCVICRKWEGGPFKPPPPPQLPKERILKASPFTYIGIDFLGPLFVKEANRMSKVWVCLFTCAVTRAVHLEIVSSMSTDDFLECLRRFIARRGRPAVIISDNAKQFQLADAVLQKVWSTFINDERVFSYIANEGIRWKFIVQLAPWMGGFYERLVGLTKRSMRKMVGTRRLTFRQLDTVLIEIEAILNSRPLGFVGETLEDTEILSPSMFLGTSNRAGIPVLEFGDDDLDREYRNKTDSVEALMGKWKIGQKTLNKFGISFTTSIFSICGKEDMDEESHAALSTNFHNLDRPY